MPSESFKKLNPTVGLMIFSEAKRKRIRQSSKPLLNKLEQDFLEQILNPNNPAAMILKQSLRFRLANGVWYKPDFFVVGKGGTLWAYECKGPHAFRGGKENLKMAASSYPFIKWTLVWKEGTAWVYQTILP